MIWETTTVRRIECIAERATDALTAIDERLRKMRREGWLVPDDSAVDLRPSGFGWAARLVLPEESRTPQGGFVMRRRLGRSRRTVSGVELRPNVTIEIAKDA